MPVTKINKPQDDKKEPWNFGDDDGNEDDDTDHEDKVPLTAKHLSATDIQEQLTDISKKVEKVLDKYPGLELEIFYQRKTIKLLFLRLKLVYKTMAVGKIFSTIMTMTSLIMLKS